MSLEQILVSFGLLLVSLEQILVSLEQILVSFGLLLVSFGLLLVSFQKSKTWPASNSSSYLFSQYKKAAIRTAIFTI
ncbi:hypothetical protein QNH26_19260 [Peribacillus frigoritolerans]|uniref:hypothetical protein n=1 Tax=Peribacillus frigoritolerans TaxID=450367 RepID=UPI0024C166A8|nr:hypothetical protein [Peribacillus frigoritolerans]WHX65807.1 hypothetical protein QNH26_19260 [Peribacillus frigoritolerans]